MAGVSRCLCLGGPGGQLSVLLPQIEGGRIAGFERQPAASVIPLRWRRKTDVAGSHRSVIYRYLQCRGPVTPFEIANHTGWAAGLVDELLQDLVGSDRASRGVYTADKPSPQWVDRANLQEIHRRSLQFLKRELAACAPCEVVDFVTRWQHLHPDTRLEGVEGLRSVVQQLQGYELLTGVLESEVLAGRVDGYTPAYLEQLIASGEVRWQRVGDGVRRGQVTLCLTEDAGWLSRGRPHGGDVEPDTEEDIAGPIAQVRACFAGRRQAFFDEIVDDTDLDEAAVLRVVFFLAWAGELTCGTYECLRHSDFRSLTSACYGIGDSPRDIVSGRLDARLVVERMAERKLDPRLGPWIATERLLACPDQIDRDEVIQHWARQLLHRWGIVTQDIVGVEGASPPWHALLPELKRLELTGQVHRGYFIESHRGEQYGLPDAVELLRECRARRGDRAGHIDGEPILRLAGRDPANLYASCLDITLENGERAPGIRRGGLRRPVAIQAGQALLYDDRLLSRLPRRAVKDCVDVLRRSPSGSEIRTVFTSWNGEPVTGSPVADVLWEMGFRFERPDRLAWPPHARARSKPDLVHQEVFLPYHEVAPLSLGPEWTVGRVPEALSPAMRVIVRTLRSQVTRDGWRLTWTRRGPRAVCVTDGLIKVGLGKRSIRVHVWEIPDSRDGHESERPARIRFGSESEARGAFRPWLLYWIDRLEENI